MHDAPEVKNQIALADVILLNKVDLVSTDELHEVEGRIRAINPYVRLHRTERCRISLTEIVGRNAFDLERILDIVPDFLGEEEHGHDHAQHWSGHHPHGQMVSKQYHDEEIQSLSLRLERPLDPQKFFPWMKEFIALEGASVLRCKGIVSLKDDPRRFVFHGIHMILEGTHQRPWADGEARTSRAVFIGRNLPEDKIRAGFFACVV